ncbi:MAG: phosphoribosyltransferase family protein [Actinomycetaceae bacterium]|nr:phosphoribosyltransferase family protein [Actinomycetaceae bacterium]
MSWKQVLEQLAKLLFPTQCVGCAEWGSHLCVKCFAESLAQSRYFRFTSEEGQSYPGVSFGDYRGVLRQTIIAAKHDEVLDFSTWVFAAGELLGETLLTAPGFREVPALVVPIPSGKKRVRRRMLVTPTLARGVVSGLDNFGMETSFEVGLALASSETTLLPTLFMPVRELLGTGVSQQGLGAKARSRTKRGSMVASPVVNGQKVILVDDVLTTGATMREGVRAVAKAGGEVVAVVCLADLQR